MPENRLKLGVSAIQAYNKPRHRAFLWRGFVRFIFCLFLNVKKSINVFVRSRLNSVLPA